MAYVPPHLRGAGGAAKPEEPEPADENRGGDRGRDNAQRAEPPSDRFAALKEDDGPRNDRKGGGKGDGKGDGKGYGKGERRDRGDGDGGKGGGKGDGERGGGGGGGGKGNDKGGYGGGQKGGGRGDVDNTGLWKNRGDGRRGGGEDKTELEVFGEVKTRSTAGIDFDKYDAIPVQLTGDNVEHIKPITRFSEAKLCDALFDNLRRCGYDRPTPVQKHSIPIVVSGRDVMACAQTGSGKTCAFMVPCLESLLRSGPPPSLSRGRKAAPCALVLAPTRELASQIHAESLKFAFESGIRCCIVYGGADMREQRMDLEKGCDILVATPGRLTDMCDRGNVVLELIQFFILDEADRMLDMGFEPQVRAIVEQHRMGAQSKFPRQSMMFSATFAREVQYMARDFLKDYVFITVGRVGSASELVQQLVVYAGELKQKVHALERALKEHCVGPADLAVVFVETKRAADDLELHLHTAGVQVTAIHGDRSQEERESALHAFKTGANPVMVATDVAARGLDIPNVALVINFDMPKQIDDYVHRIGRTGRAGRKGTAIAFVNEKCNYLGELGTLLKEAKHDPPMWFDDLCKSAGRRTFGGGGGGKGGGKGKGGPVFGGADLREEEAQERAKANPPPRSRADDKARPGGGDFGNTGVEDSW